MAHQPRREPPPETALPGDTHPTPVEDPVTRLPARGRRSPRAGDWIWLTAVAIVIAVVVWGWAWGFAT